MPLEVITFQAFERRIEKFLSFLTISFFLGKILKRKATTIKLKAVMAF